MACSYKTIARSLQTGSASRPSSLAYSPELSQGSVASSLESPHSISNSSQTHLRNTLLEMASLSQMTQLWMESRALSLAASLHSFVSFARSAAAYLSKSETDGQKERTALASAAYYSQPDAD